jgi:large subunit ribosomal protein L25
MTITLSAEKREAGKASAARKAGKIPAVVYGRHQEATSISIDRIAFLKALEEAGESTIIELKGLGADHDVLIKAVEFDPVTDAPIHADFYAVEKGQKVSVAVPIEFEGVSPAVKDQGGMLVKVMHEIEVEGEPKNLPHEFVVDISKLATLEDKITVADLRLPAGVTTENDPEDVVALIDVAKEEEEAAPIDITQIEMSVEKGKKEEEEEAVSE